jgi:sugar O-acyltransferase (sialic acid O-acetyltransferase NeuD family)
MKRLLIVGAGGFGRELMSYAREVSERDGFTVGGFLDPDPKALDGFDCDARILGDEREWAVEADDRFLIAVGDPEQRARIHDALVRRSAQFHTLIHPMAWKAPTARLGPGTIMAPFSSVTADAVVGMNVLLNISVCIGHNATVGDHSVISPLTIVTGACTIGDKAFIASSCVIAPKRVLGKRSTISAGAVVFRNVPENALARGNPAVSQLNWRKPES